MTRVAGSVAVVTGGASGIGRGIAEQLIARGARVAIADIEAGAVEAAAAEIGAHPLVADVSRLEDVQGVADQVLERFGRVDIVVNNAGVGPFARIADLTMDDWRWMIDVNLFGVIHGVHVFLPLLEANPDGGHLVNTSSMSALTPFETLGSYAVTKFGVHALTEVLQAELASAGSQVHATLLVPGSVRTGIAQSTRHRPADAPGSLRDAQIGLGFSSSSRWLDPADVGRITVRAIENDDPYAITHPDRWPAVAARFAGIQAAFEKYPPIDGEA
ncbi:MAG: SDR family NAD(P)-dependent oxidoreductase [Actinomycetales bacterium]|nr:SDR family NAD(P)-dependent oxidoreductase [Actinomycetales bacterium]